MSRLPPLRRRRPRSVAEHIDDPTGDPPQGEGTAWSHGSVLATHALRGLVLGVVALSALGGLGVLVGGSSPPAVAPVVESTPHSTRAEAFAEHAVGQWLIATAAAPGETPQIFDIEPRDLPDTAPIVDNITAADSTGVEPGVWSVLVAADVTEQAPAAASSPAAAKPAPAPSGHAAPPTIRRYFQIAVVVDDTGAVGALTLPSPTSSPQLGAARRAYPVDLPVDDPIAVASGEFLSAYLTGAGPLDRLVSPGSSLRAPAPPPYTAVAVTDVRALADPDDVAVGEPLRVVVAARAESATRSYDLEYALTLAVRAGRWEVAAIDLAPAIDQPSIPAPSVTPTPAQ